MVHNTRISLTWRSFGNFIKDTQINVGWQMWPQSVALFLTPEKERFGVSRITYRGKGRAESRALQLPWSLRERRVSLPASQNMVMIQSLASSRHSWHTKKLRNIQLCLSHTIPVGRSKRAHSYVAKFLENFVSSFDFFLNVRGKRPSTKMIR